MLKNELLEIFENHTLIHADQIPVKGTSVTHIDSTFFSFFFEKLMGEPFDHQDIPLAQLMENMNLMKNGQLNICSTLLFSTYPQRFLPVFMVKAVSFPGVDIADY